MQKKCPKCNQVKSIDDFWKDRSRRDGHASYCKNCSYEKNKKWKNSEAGKRWVKKFGKSYDRNKSHLSWRCRKLYGITEEKRKQTYLKQNGCCAICGRAVPYNKIHTDHNHIENKFRGLLCIKCNLGAGMFDVDLVGGLFLKYAIKYLKETE